MPGEVDRLERRRIKLRHPLAERRGPLPQPGAAAQALRHTIYKARQPSQDRLPYH